VIVTESGHEPLSSPAAGRPSRALALLLRVTQGSYLLARRIVIGLVGLSTVVVGVVMIVTPGPALVVIPLGLGILALEFVWARRLLRLFRVRTRQMYRGHRRGWWKNVQTARWSCLCWRV
jgi:uncharacterized protein (TIGR02611 family)